VAFCIERVLLACVFGVYTRDSFAFGWNMHMGYTPRDVIALSKYNW
jgi:hypothetical protein